MLSASSLLAEMITFFAPAFKCNAAFSLSQKNPVDSTWFFAFSFRRGEICSILYRLLSGSLEIDLLPALGTHRPMTGEEMERMFPGIPQKIIHVHDWCNGVCRLGEIPGDFVRKISNGKVDYPVHVELASRIIEGKYDSHNFRRPDCAARSSGHGGRQQESSSWGVPGRTPINKSHFLGAVCNMEKINGTNWKPGASIA